MGAEADAVVEAQEVVVIHIAVLRRLILLQHQNQLQAVAQHHTDQHSLQLVINQLIQVVKAPKLTQMQQNNTLVVMLPQSQLTLLQLQQGLTH